MGPRPKSDTIRENYELSAKIPEDVPLRRPEQNVRGIHAELEDDEASESELAGGPKERRKPKGEQPKVLYARNRARAFYHFLIYHALPLAGALALLVLNFKTRFYGSSDTVAISALQYAAKAHELLMQLSIVTITTAFFQRLVTRSPIPFGAIFTGSQVTNPGYLVSKAFWGALTERDFQLSTKLTFGAFVAFMSILATVVGPSSAVAMQPRFVNFTLPNAQTSYNGTMETWYPQKLDSSGSPLAISRNDSSSSISTLTDENPASPAAGWEFLQQIQSFVSPPQTGLQQVLVPTSPNGGKPSEVEPEVYVSKMGTFYPANFSSGSVDSVERSLHTQWAANSTLASIQHVPVAFALLDGVASFIDDFSDYVPVDPGSIVANLEMPQAVVGVYCEPNWISGPNDTRPIQFPSTFIAGGSECLGHQEDIYNCGNALVYPPITNYTAIPRRKLWDESQSNSSSRVIWIDSMPITFPTSTNVLGAIVIEPNLCESSDPNQYLATSACLIGATWTNVSSSIACSTVGERNACVNPAATSDISTSFMSSSALWTSSPLVQLTSTWASSLDAETDVQNRTVLENLLRWAPETDAICPSDRAVSSSLVSTLLATWLAPEWSSFGVPKYARTYPHEALLAGLIANGMSHAGGSLQRYRLWDGSWSFNDLNGKSVSADPAIVLSVSGSLPGYAWNLDGVPIKLALTALLVYCLVTTPYVLYTFVTGRSSSTWSEIWELLALALNSRPPSANKNGSNSKILKNASAGIDRMRTYGHRLAVREREGTGELEMVFEEEDEQSRKEVRMVSEGKAY